MPPRVRVVDPLQSMEVPASVAHAMRSESEREDIPIRKTLNGNAVPYSGEEREATFTHLRGALNPGQTAILATLRRSWDVIGFTIDPGNAGVPGLTASLRVLGRGISGTIVSVAVVGNGQPQSFVGFLVGARCELVVHNPSPGPGDILRRVGGEIWGKNLGYGPYALKG